MRTRMMENWLWRAGAMLWLAVAVPAQAAPCADALAAFDYAEAGRLAAARLAAAPSDPLARLCAARADYESGRFDAALQQLRALERGRPQGEVRTAAYNWLTVTLRKLGHEPEAMAYGRAALAWARREANRQNLATALHNLAGLAYTAGDPATAVVLYRESVPLNPDLSERSASLNNLGLIAQAAGDRTAAERWLEQAIALNRAHGHFHHLGKHLMNLGNLKREAGEFESAAELIEEGATLIDRAGDRYWQAVAARYRGWLARDRGDRAAAGRWLAEAAAIYADIGARVDADATRAEGARLQTGL